ncbi:MAG: conserved exported protein of unknown function [Nitrospira sp.]|nr:MAG: conserved exported protein of unknown function [Nitrospira sp.]
MKHQAPSKTLSKVACAVAIMLSAVLTTSPAPAALMQFSFTGAVNSVGFSLFPTINNDTKLSGLMTINTSTADSNPSAPISSYTNGIQSLTLSLGPSTATLGTTDNTIDIHHFTSYNQYALSGPLTGPAFNGPGSSIPNFAPVKFEFDGNASNSIFPPSLSSFSSNEWRMLFGGPGGSIVTVKGSLTSLTAVPLPAAVVLFGAGLVALAGLGAGRWKQTTRVA